MRSALLPLLLAAPALAAAASGARKTYKVSLDDFSPMLVWDPPIPSSDVDHAEAINETTNTWNAAWTESPMTVFKPWMAGIGQSFHYGREGMTMEVVFDGTDITVSGQAVPDMTFDGEASLSVDGQPSVPCSNPGGVLSCVVEGLGTGNHTATLTVTSGVVAVGSVDISYGITTSLSDPTTAPVEDWQAWVEEGNHINPKLQTTGFSPETEYLNKDTEQYPRIYTNITNASVRFTVPERTTLLELWGAVDYDHRNFTISIFPNPPVGKNNYVLSAFNPWTTRDQILFVLGLDPNIAYDIQFIHYGTQASIYTDISMVRFIKDVAAVKKASSVSVGLIAGIVVGVVVGLVIVGLLVWFLCFRRRREGRASHPLKGTIDNDEPVYGPQPTPLQAPRPDSNEPLLTMRNNHHGPRSTVSGYTSSSGDPWADAETASATTAGMAGYGAGPRDSFLSVPAGVAKARMASREANNGQGSINHIINQHADGGSYTHNPRTNTVVEDVPPSYNPDWVSSGPSEAGGSRASEFGEGWTNPPPHESRR